MATLTIELGLIDVTGNGRSIKIDPAKWTDPAATIEEAVAYAYGVKLQRCTASAKDKDAAINSMIEKLQGPEPHEGAGGRGPSLSREETATRAVYERTFRALKVKAVDAKKASTQQDRLELLVQLTLAKALTDSGLNATEAAKKIQSNPEAVKTATAKIEADVKAQIEKELNPPKTSGLSDLFA